MKKLVVTAVFSACAFSASAAGLKVMSSLDYDSANAGQFFRSQYELSAGVATMTRFGQVDGLLVSRQLNSVGRDEALGFEVGYSNGLKVGKVSLNGRAAYGRLNQVDTTGGGFSGNSQYYSLAAEAVVPVTSKVNGYVGFRHRNGLTSETPATSNRYSLGGEMALGKKTAVRLGYSHTRSAGEVFNGLSTSVNYKF